MVSWRVLSISRAASPFPAAAEWSAVVFAPYVYLGAGDNFQQRDAKRSADKSFPHPGFHHADQHNDPAWDGRSTMEHGLCAGQIDAIRRAGGDVIASFGGEGGTELAIAEPDPLALGGATKL